MTARGETINFTSNAATTDANYPSNSGLEWGGGYGVITISGTPNGATFKLQMLYPNSSTWVDVPGMSFTAIADAPRGFVLPRGVFLRMNVASSGGSTSLSAIAIPCEGQLLTALSLSGVTPGSGASSLGKAEDAAHSSGDIGVMMLSVRKDTAAATAGTDGDYQPPITDSSGRMHVNVGVLPGTLAGTADDAVASGNPAMIGAVAVETDNTDPTSVSAEGDIAYLRTDRNRRLLVNGRHPNGFLAADNQSSAQTNTSLKTAPGANLSIYITDIIFSNGATAGTIKLVEDPAGTPADIGKVKYLDINGGCHIALKTPIRLTPNKALGYTSVTVTTHTVEVLGYIAP